MSENMRESDILKQILHEIKKAKNIVILTHENPDGDAVGSSMGMKYILNALDKDADVIIPQLPKIFNFIPGIELVKIDSDIEEYDLAISVDCTDVNRLDSNKHFINAKKTIVIDHHVSNTMFGDINYIDSKSPACAQVLFDLIYEYEIDLNLEIGTSLMTGILTDTGGFRHYGINEETFGIASEALCVGVDISKIYKAVLKTKTKSRFELFQIATKRLELVNNGTVAITYITEQDENSLKCEKDDYEGIVDIGTEIEGVEVSVFLREQSEKRGYKVSLRSTGDVNVSEVCSIFNGGGHIRAAGAFIETLELEKVKQLILNEIFKVIV